MRRDLITIALCIVVGIFWFTSMGLYFHHSGNAEWIDIALASGIAASSSSIIVYFGRKKD